MLLSIDNSSFHTGFLISILHQVYLAHSLSDAWQVHSSQIFSKYSDTAWLLWQDPWQIYHLRYENQTAELEPESIEI